MALSEIVRFTLHPSYNHEFAKLRRYVSANGGVRDQYFGYMEAPLQAALPFEKDEICWVIQWPHGSDMRTSASFKAQLNELTRGRQAKSLLFDFKDIQTPELEKALDAPVCEFAIINLLPTAPLSDADFKHSMHKTYTDCYHMEGFTGGNWAYALNTNDTSGVLIESAGNQLMQETDRRLACYYLGWKSKEHHQAASGTPLFAEEITKLMPWFGPGSGAWYVTFKKDVV